MEKEIGNEKECKDCIYYIQHYVKWKNRFDAISCGHCANKKPSGHSRKTDKICECYEERDLIKEKEKQFESATKSLHRIAESLYQLNEILRTYDMVDKIIL